MGGKMGVVFEEKSVIDWDYDLIKLALVLFILS